MDTPNKEITNDELAVLINRGFEHVQEQLSDVRQDISSVKDDLKRLQGGQETMFEIVREFSPKRMKQLDATLDDHEKRLKKLETKPA